MSATVPAALSPVSASFYRWPGGGGFGEACEAVARRLGFVEATSPAEAAVAFAPLLTYRIPRVEYEAPRFGTLVFHPSALPYRRGPDAIKHTVLAGERVSAATWFWCAEGWDTGPVCEQEVVVLAPGESPGRAYHTRFQPAGLRALERALEGVLFGRPRRVPQDEALATYDRRLTAAEKA